MPLSSLDVRPCSSSALRACSFRSQASAATHAKFPDGSISLEGGTLEMLDRIDYVVNWRQGFFRVWVLGSALFVISVAALNYTEIKSQFDGIAVMEAVKHDEIFVPVVCLNARGIEGTHFQNSSAAL